MAQSKQAPGTFTANDCTWVVSTDGLWVTLHTDLETGGYVGHVGPITQWIPEVRAAARDHLKAHAVQGCTVI